MLMTNRPRFGHSGQGFLNRTDLDCKGHSVDSHPAKTSFLVVHDRANFIELAETL